MSSNSLESKKYTLFVFNMDSKRVSGMLFCSLKYNFLRKSKFILIKYTNVREHSNVVPFLLLTDLLTDGGIF